MTDIGSKSRRSHPAWVVFCLWLGVLAPLLFAAIAIVGGAMRPGYSHVSQAISELTEAGAADKVFLDPALLVTELMGIAFGVGMFYAVRHLDGRLKASAVLLAFIGLIGLGYHSNPMDPIGAEMTFEGRMHIVIVSVSAVCAILAVTLAALGWARGAEAQNLSRLSWLALAVMLVTGFAAIPVAVFGWPGMGLWQRANTTTFGLWQIATALYLLRRPAPYAQH